MTRLVNMAIALALVAGLGSMGLRVVHPGHGSSVHAHDLSMTSLAPDMLRLIGSGWTGAKSCCACLSEADCAAQGELRLMARIVPAPDGILPFGTTITPSPAPPRS